MTESGNPNGNVHNENGNAPVAPETRLKNFFLGSQQNNFYPGLLKPGVLVTIALLFIIFGIVNNFLFNRHPATASDLVPATIMDAVNHERAIRNLNALNTDSRLTKAAEYKAQDMQTRHYFSHTDPEGNYIWGTIVADGYTPYLQLGENLAIDFDSTESLVAAWMNSPTHRANVLNEGFKDQGMGVAFGDAGTGGYSSAIANTFGALAVKQQTSPTYTPPSQPAPAPTAPVQKPAPKPGPAPAPAPQPKTPATATASSTPVVSTPVATKNKISIQKDSLQLTTDVKGASLQVSMQIGILGQPDTVTASVGEYTSLLSSASVATSAASTTTFAGSLQLPLHETSTSTPVQIYAQNRYGQSDVYNTYLNEAATLPTPQDKGVVQQIPAQKSFNFYKFNRYVALAVGILLLLFMITDIKLLAQCKLEHLDKKINNLVLLILSLIVIALLYWL